MYLFALMCRISFQIELEVVFVNRRGHLSLQIASVGSIKHKLNCIPASLTPFKSSLFESTCAAGCEKCARMRD